MFCGLQSFSELFVSFLESESDLASGEAGSTRVRNPLLSGATHHVIPTAGRPMATSTPVGTPARNNMPPLPTSAIARPLTGSASVDSFMRYVGEVYRIYSNKRRLRISAAFGTKKLISAAVPMRRLFEVFRTTRKTPQKNSKTALEISFHQKQCSSVQSD